MLFNLKVNCLARIVVTAFKSNSKSFETDAFKINIDIMSQSNRTLEDSSLQSSENSRDEEADVSDENSLLSEPLDLRIRKDTAGSEPDKNSVNQNNREGENEKHEVESQADPVPVEDSRDTVHHDVRHDVEPRVADRPIVPLRSSLESSQIKRNCPTCKITVANAKVSVKQWCPSCGTELGFQCGGCDQSFNTYHKLNAHQLSCSSVITHDCNFCAFTTKHKYQLDKHMIERHDGVDESTATKEIKKPSFRINQFCPSCWLVLPDGKLITEKQCTQCKTEWFYQCARCNKQYKVYGFVNLHVRACNPQKPELYCPFCGCPAESQSSMEMHLGYCITELHYRCCYCEYTDANREFLHRHMTNVHTDNLGKDCCRGPFKCEKCLKKVTICETCHTGFNSTDGFQEHKESCKPPELKCKYCLYNTNKRENYKMHMILAHS